MMLPFYVGTFKVSYYGNPVLDVLTNDGALLSRYPSYRQPNIWLADHLPELDIDLLQLREALGYKWIMFASLVRFFITNLGPLSK